MDDPLFQIGRSFILSAHVAYVRASAMQLAVYLQAGLKVGRGPPGLSPGTSL